MTAVSNIPVAGSTRGSGAPGTLETWLARAMFSLSLAFLFVAAGVLHRVGGDLDADFETVIIFMTLGLLWPIFVAENVLRFLWWGRRGVAWPIRLRTLLWGCLVPPARLSFHGYNDPGLMWLPYLGWSPIDKQLRGRLERFFSAPMIIIALLILPFLVLEVYWKEKLPDHPGMKLFLDLGASVIWLAFAAEFIIMVSVAKNKLRHCVQNWMDLAIVLLPVLEFMPVLRLLRLTRLLQAQQLSRMGRLYRLRGLLFKAWRAVLVLQVVQRLFGNREKRLARLRELLHAKREEIAELEKEIAELESQMPAATTGPFPLEESVAKAAQEQSCSTAST